MGIGMLDGKYIPEMSNNEILIMDITTRDIPKWPV